MQAEVFCRGVSQPCQHHPKQRCFRLHPHPATDRSAAPHHLDKPAHSMFPQLWPTSTLILFEWSGTCWKGHLHSWTFPIEQQSHNNGMSNWQTSSVPTNTQTQPECEYHAPRTTVTLHAWGVMKVLPQARLSPIQRLKCLAALHNDSCCRSTFFSGPQERSEGSGATERSIPACSYLRPPGRRLVHPFHYRLQSLGNFFRHRYFPHSVKTAMTQNVKKRVRTDDTRLSK